VFNHWVTILLTIAAVGSAIGTIFGWFRLPIRWWHSRPKRKAQPKGITLSFVQRDPQCHWGGATLNDQSGTYVSGHWHITNSSKSDVMILKARLGKYANHFVSHVLTRHPEDERKIFGQYPIQSHRMSEVSADFTFFPPIARAPKPLITEVIFTDNFGNEHRVRSQFSYFGPKPAHEPSLWSRLMRR
jgi:hypothetical protein